jgi:hypothetical protein
MRKPASDEATERGHLDLERGHGAQDLLRDPGRVDLIDDPGRWDIVEYLGRLELATRDAPRPAPAQDRDASPTGSLVLNDPSPTAPLLAAIPVFYRLDWTFDGTLPVPEGIANPAPPPRDSSPAYSGHRVDPAGQGRNLPRMAGTCKCPHCRSEGPEGNLLPSAGLAVGRWH